MHLVYILYSPSKDKYYVGETAHLDGRLVQHNSGYYKNASTKVATDWEVFLSVNCNDRDEALRLEKFIKKQKSRKFIEKLKNEEGVLASVLEKVR